MRRLIDYVRSLWARLVARARLELDSLRAYLDI